MRRLHNRRSGIRGPSFGLMLVTTSLVLWFSGVPGQAQNSQTEGGEKPPALLSGIGKHTHPITTRNSEAQKFFDQGLTLLYGFNRYEALRSFERAAELDPLAAMPHWGIAMAFGPHINMDLDGDVDLKKSCEALRAAQALLENASERERAYVAAASVRCPEYQPVAYQKAMRDLADSYPDDLDAATLYAESLMIPVRWKWWTPDGTPAEGMQEAISILESVMRRDLDHPGANHFYIHAVEMSPSPERAIASAQRLMATYPSAGHLLHMPSHIWLLLGDFDLAAEVNLRAAAADEEYMRSTGVTGSAYAGYYIHNLHFVAYNRSMEGRRAESLAAAEKIAEAAAPFAPQMPMMIDAYAPWPLFARLRFGRWDQILELQPPDPKLLASRALWHYGRGVALAAQGRGEQAHKERDAFQAARRQVSADQPWLTSNTAAGILNVAAAMLDARLAENDSAAVAYWEQAVKAQDALSYDEPPPWFYPVRESLGGALLQAGRAREAEATFREGLRHTPRDGRMLFGLIQSLKAQGKTEAAGMVQQEFEKAWSKADVSLRLEDL